MPSKEFLQALSDKAASLFPEAGAMRDEIRQKLYALMQSSFDKLDLVTREEFDSQVAALRRAEATIAELEKKVTELEAG